MQEFKCIAMDGGGKEHRLDILAEDQKEAISVIKEKGMFPVSVRAKDEVIVEAPTLKGVANRTLILATAVVAIVFAAITISICYFYSGDKGSSYPYENDVKQTIKEMVREGCLKNQ